ncbi:PYRP2 [Scenedesmus sp. PABB004]|nr:PYRP2 [Scenedesmus sp. PABB004]
MQLTRLHLQRGGAEARRGAVPAAPPSLLARAPRGRAARHGRAAAAPRDGAAAAPGDEPPPAVSPYAAQQMARALGAAGAPLQTRVGGWRGEGFTHLLGAGPVRRVDVDALNEALRPAGALRLRHAQHPHEAYGMVFSFDGVIADMPTIRREAWVLLAAETGLHLPHGLLAHPELLAAPPEVAVVRLLRWAPDRKAGVALAMRYAELAGRLLATHSRPQEGVREWLDTLGRFNVPCALVSALDRQSVQAALARMALHDHFTATVTAEDEAETIAQSLLAAAVKLGRPPNACVYFDSTPAGVTAAHNVTMRAVGVMARGRHRSALKAADITCGSLSELTVINMRRLFANMGSELMDLQRAASARHDDSGDDARRRRRRITNATID